MVYKRVSWDFTVALLKYMDLFFARQAWKQTNYNIF